jgi:hypothetical protein
MLLGVFSWNNFPLQSRLKQEDQYRDDNESDVGTDDNNSEVLGRTHHMFSFNTVRTA